MTALKRFILWDYKRASWQYDVIVVLILAFIFVIPREFFRDQPKPAAVAMVHGGYWIDPQQLAGAAQADLNSRAASLVNRQYKIHTEIEMVEPIYDETEHELKGYLAFPRQ